MTDDELDDPPTIVAPCPAWDRLDALMSGDSKVTRDGWNPQAFSQWWTYGADRETA